MDPRLPESVLPRRQQHGRLATPPPPKEDTREWKHKRSICPSEVAAKVSTIKWSFGRGAGRIPLSQMFAYARRWLRSLNSLGSPSDSLASCSWTGYHL